LYGNVGLGKTHLLHAICHDARKQAPYVNIQFHSCEQFVNGFISAIEQGCLTEFQNQYRGVDILIIDDVQFLREREQSQEEFFHTFNALYNNRKQIILTADCAPQDLAALEDRLISRFKWGLVARLDAPSYETRIAIVKKKASLRGLMLPDNVSELIAEQIKTNIRELEGALTVIYAQLAPPIKLLVLNLPSRPLASRKRQQPAALQCPISFVQSAINLMCVSPTCKAKNAVRASRCPSGLYVSGPKPDTS
jgi:chromosomal replication initiator protein